MNLTICFTKTPVGFMDLSMNPQETGMTFSKLNIFLISKIKNRIREPMLCCSFHIVLLTSPGFYVLTRSRLPLMVTFGYKELPQVHSDIWSNLSDRGTFSSDDQDVVYWTLCWFLTFVSTKAQKG